MIETARAHDAGVFVLALTSNKEGPEVQHARTADGSTVAGTVLAHLRRLNDGAEPLGSFGAVIGATIGESAEDLAFNGPVLAPGYGAQGGTPADIRRIFGAAAGSVLASSSREVLRLGPDAAAMHGAVRRRQRRADRVAACRRAARAAQRPQLPPSDRLAARFPVLRPQLRRTAGPAR